MPRSSSLSADEITRAVAAAVAAVLQQQQQPPQNKPTAPAAEARKVKRVKAATAPTKRSHRGFRGLPPPPEFDLDGMPAGNLLTEFETAAATRLSTTTLAAWRQRPDHPLKWQKIGTRVRYRAGDVRRFIATGQRPQIGRPRKKDKDGAPAPRRRTARPRAEAVT